jgi:phosphoribosylanthranilate isomerase
MRVRIKICGLTHPDDVLDAVAAGADAIGFNFYPKSSRFIDSRAAGPLIRRVGPFVEPVGVFVEASMAEMRETAVRLGLRAMQWHGAGLAPNEDSFPLQLIAAYRVRNEIDLKAIGRDVRHRWMSGNPLGAVLLDAHVPGQFGGTGRTIPWSLLSGFDPGPPLIPAGGVPVILAGGLTPENVAEAVRIVRPYGVDVASGVESSPGRKDAEKMRRFVQAVRESEIKR